jgi:hypothetical protein
MPVAAAAGGRPPAILADAQGGAGQELEPALAQVGRGSPVRTKIRHRKTTLRRRSQWIAPAGVGASLQARG